MLFVLPIVSLLLTVVPTARLPAAPMEATAMAGDIRVQVLSCDGQPAKGVAIRLLDRKSSFVFGLTDERGLVTLPLDSRQIEDGVFASFGVVPTTTPSIAPKDSDEALRRNAELTKRCSFRGFYRLVSTETLEIRGRPAVQITIKAVRAANGAAVEAVFAPSRTGYERPCAWTPSSEPLVVSGVERASSYTLFAVSACAGRPVDFNDSQTQSDIVLESISLPPLGHSGTLTVDFTDDEVSEDISIRPYYPGVTLLSADGSSLYRYRLRAIDGSPKRVSVGATNDLKRECIPPAGRYFLFAGSITGGMHDAADLREVMRRGGKLEELGIPFVDIVEGADTKVTFDPAKARAAARKAARTLPDDPAN
jgi:hypothetical protein